MRLLTMPTEEKTELVNTVLDNYKKISGEQFDPEEMGVIVGLVFGELMKKAASRSPGCYVAMPKELTAENGAKYLLIGEFSEIIEIDCCECAGDGCEECNGNGHHNQKVPVSWTTIKEIYAMAVKHLAT